MMKVANYYKQFQLFWTFLIVIRILVIMDSSDFYERLQLLERWWKSKKPFVLTQSYETSEMQTSNLKCNEKSLIVIQ